MLLVSMPTFSSYVFIGVQPCTWTINLSIVIQKSYSQIPPVILDHELQTTTGFDSQQLKGADICPGD